MIMKYILRNMGSCFLIQLRQPKRISSIDTPVESTTTTCQEKVVRVLKMSGKVAVAYRSSVLVKDVLVNFTGFGLEISEESSQILPPNYELKTGNVYYLHPTNSQSEDNNQNLSGEVKQIKVIITKQQLQELLTKKGSIEGMIANVSKGLFDHNVDDDTREVGSLNLKLYRKEVNRN
ncbi:hypothetical protein C5167_004486 [Papaver somniferum]|uniref:DUF4228 domain-containing protein n=1 Tax=Papaver somniferum TaxID=3469 RepID=A0A4Y7JB72_PAPSO|nr:hypothetical protein C5167_004486 [Papaver somniferum]